MSWRTGQILRNPGSLKEEKKDRRYRGGKVQEGPFFGEQRKKEGGLHFPSAGREGKKKEKVSSAV